MKWGRTLQVQPQVSGGFPSRRYARDFRLSANTVGVAVKDSVTGIIDLHVSPNQPSQYNTQSEKCQPPCLTDPP